MASFQAPIASQSKKSTSLIRTFSCCPHVPLYVLTGLATRIAGINCQAINFLSAAKPTKRSRFARVPRHLQSDNWPSRYARCIDFDAVDSFDCVAVGFSVGFEFVSELS